MDGGLVFQDKPCRKPAHEIQKPGPRDNTTTLANAGRYVGYWESWSSRPCIPVEDARSTKLATTLSQREFLEEYRSQGDGPNILRTRTGFFEYTGFNCTGRREVTAHGPSHKLQLMNDETTEGKTYNRYQKDDPLSGRQHGIIILMNENTMCKDWYWTESPGKPLPNSTDLLLLAEKTVKAYLARQTSANFLCYQRVKY